MVTWYNDKGQNTIHRLFKLIGEVRRHETFYANMEGGGHHCYHFLFLLEYNLKVNSIFTFIMLPFVTHCMAQQTISKLFL